MKKWLIALLVLLAGCSPKPQYYMYVYYAKTCPICRSFISTVLPALEDKYGETMVIEKMDIDEESSIDAYAKTCSLLEDYYADDDSGSVPFIVLDGYFAKVGYEIDEQEDILQAVENAIEGKELPSTLEDVYYFKEGKTFH